MGLVYVLSWSSIILCKFWLWFSLFFWGLCCCHQGLGNLTCSMFLRPGYFADYCSEQLGSWNLPLRKGSKDYSWCQEMQVWNTFSACLTAVIFISSVAISLTKAFLMTLYIQTTTLYHWMVLPLTNKVLLRLTCVCLLLTKSFTNHLHKILSASGLLNGRMMFISS